MKNHQRTKNNSNIEDHINSTRDSNHTLRNRLIAVQGFCELIVKEDSTENIEKYMQNIRNIVKDIAQISDRISKKHNLIYQEKDKSCQEKLLEDINHEFNIITASIIKLKSTTEIFLEETQTSNSKVNLYKQKVLIVLEQLSQICPPD